MAIIKVRRKKGFRYKAEVFVRGVRVEARTFDTKSLAQRWHDETKERYLFGVRDRDDRKPFIDALDEYLTVWQGSVSANTYDSLLWRYELIKSVAKDAGIDHVPMAYFSSEHVEKLLFALKASPHVKNHGVRTGYTVELTRLTAFFNWYHDARDKSFNNPVTKRHRKLATLGREHKKEVQTYVSPQDLLRWLEFLESKRNKLWFYFFSTMFRLGIRPGECAGLTWDSFDFEKKTVRISKKVYWKHRTRAPKLQHYLKGDRRIAEISFSSELKVQLLKWKLVCPRNPENLLFTAPRDGGYLKQAVYQDAANSAFKALGMPYRTAKILRHSHATLGLLANGGNISEIQGRLGHARRATTETYARPLVGDAGNVPAKLEQLISESRQNHAEGGGK